MNHSHPPSPSRILWGRRAVNALEELAPADKVRIANKVFTTIELSLEKRSDIAPVREGRGLLILRASEHLGVLFRRLEDGHVEIIDVVTRDGGRTFSAFY